jgi:hypothetical protein
MKGRTIVCLGVVTERPRPNQGLGGASLEPGPTESDAEATVDACRATKPPPRRLAHDQSTIIWNDGQRRDKTHLFAFAVGTDNLPEKRSDTDDTSIYRCEPTNNVALYNFLSTFSGTHFVAPRTYQAAVGVVF